MLLRYISDGRVYILLPALDRSSVPSLEPRVEEPDCRLGQCVVTGTGLVSGYNDGQCNSLVFLLHTLRLLHHSPWSESKDALDNKYATNDKESALIKDIGFDYLPCPSAQSLVKKGLQSLSTDPG